MKAKRVVFQKLTVALGVVLLGTVFSPWASAQCGYTTGSKSAQPQPQPRSWQAPERSRPASLLLVSDSTDGAGIVGFWKVMFVAEGNDGIPDNTVIDFGFAQWHSDGTEILNSGKRAPATGNFCLGVWKKTGRSKYQLNHFGLSSDMNGNCIGPANIREAVVLDHSGNSYSGSFTIDQFDQGETIWFTSPVKSRQHVSRWTHSPEAGRVHAPTLVFMIAGDLLLGNQGNQRVLRVVGRARVSDS